jgi:phospholipid-binding lipoprotein MlaA
MLAGTLRAIVASAVTLLLLACATPPQDPGARAAYDEANDPFEPLNREIFGFNMWLDRNAIKPVAIAYRDYIPELGRKGIRNFLNNLGEPVTFANNLLQGEANRAGTTFTRFVVNTLFGLGGFVDIAKNEGVEKQTGDFGQTLWAYGVADGPFLMLPLLGPSNPRDGIGMGVDQFISPYGYAMDPGPANWFGLGRFVTDGIDTRAGVLDELDSVERTSVDFYAQIRSLWRQKRAKDLNNGVPPPLNPDDDLYKDPGAK